METNELVFRCSRCGQLRIEPISKTQPVRERPRLRLIVSR